MYTDWLAEVLLPPRLFVAGATIKATRRFKSFEWVDPCLGTLQVGLVDTDDVSITARRNANGVDAIDDKSSDDDVIGLASGPRQPKRPRLQDSGCVGQGEAGQPAPVDEMAVAFVYEGPDSKLVAEMDPGAPEEDVVVAEAGSGGSSSEDGDASELDHQSDAPVWR